MSTNVMVETLKRWALWHPDFGFMTMKGSIAVPYDYPDPRGCYSRWADVEKRLQRSFWLNRKSNGRERHSGSELKIVEVEFIWKCSIL